MENFDAIVVFIGVALIIAGVALFITGKVVSQNNQIEAFGIKVNFNNPSFMLLVAGIGMVLVPRLLPDPHRIAELPPPAAGIPAEPSVSQANALQSPLSEPEPQTRPAVQGDRLPEPSSASSIAGTYELLSYSVNNIPQIAEGMMRVEQGNGQQYQWHTQFDSYDFYGNYMNYVYNGALDFHNGTWLLDVNSSNDPTWFDAGSVATQLMQEGDYMGLSYLYNGNYINAVWEKTGAD